MDADISKLVKALNTKFEWFACDQSYFIPVRYVFVGSDSAANYGLFESDGSSTTLSECKETGMSSRQGDADLRVIVTLKKDVINVSNESGHDGEWRVWDLK